MGKKKTSGSAKASGSNIFTRSEGWERVEVGDELITGNNDDSGYGFMELEVLDGSLAGDVLTGDMLKMDEKEEEKEKEKGLSKDELMARVEALERENQRLRTTMAVTKGTVTA